MRRHLKTNWQGVNDDVRRSYISRIKADVRQSLLDLALIVERLPEEHLADILKTDYVWERDKEGKPTIRRPSPLMRFFESLIGEGIWGGTGRVWVEQERKKVLLGRLWKTFLMELMNRGGSLAPKARAFLSMRKENWIDLEALLIGDEAFMTELPKSRRPQVG
jgi:hypothetical protein